MALISLNELKEYLGSKATEFTDSQLNLILDETYITIRQALNVDIFQEWVHFIDKTRQNTIDGDNQIFYVRNYLDKYLADKNGDGSITIADVKFYAVEADGTETNPAVSSINYQNRSITLVTAPSDVRLYIDYSYSFLDMDTPDSRVKLLAKYLALSYSYFELELDLVGTSVKMGNQTISGINTNSKTAKYRNIYNQLLKELKAYGTAKNKPTIFNVIKPENYRPNKYYGYRGFRSGNGNYYGYSGFDYYGYNGYQNYPLGGF